MKFYGNIHSGRVSNPYGGLKGLKKNLKRLGYIQLTGINGERNLILKRFNIKKKEWEFKVLYKREKEQLDYFLEQGYEIEKRFDEKITKSEILEELEHAAKIEEELKEEQIEAPYFRSKEDMKRIFKDVENYE